MGDIAPLEIQALAKIIDELDYYQILHLERDAEASAIKKAFHSTSRTFHPDTNRHLHGQLREDCARISKRVTEAYCVLRNPRRRKAYDARLDGGGEPDSGLRMQLAEAKADARQDDEKRMGRTAQGRQFYQQAAKDMAQEDWAAAAQNLQLALSFEPDNAFFKQQLEEARQNKKKRKKKT